MGSIDARAGFALDIQGLHHLKQGSQGLGQDRSGQLQAAAEQFEALFLHQVMKSMREATPRSGLMDSSATRFYESMFDQQLSSHLSGRGLGLAEQLVRQLSRETSSAGPSETPLSRSTISADKST
ncbi:rod-binding protein [Microbulbifer elongatus]|uniref:Rod-binding protein n=1 Tax=Microbulbifer elongatus TaxID=86173 RepID=A0ABT1NZR7_9GAMM|nr:rod-binding protein [Microbulbifer elongatus]MCQ3828364.1 rod-binding protein [Microbulbifer elongatus]